ncbi:hypothetical protein PN36_04250 [Candidatus Thiomargarita nelsonii]|uniref:Uncharacterized protein n=1 Tax=Candidatus Thiomargarita nelsonii TaxID=1003181 RepID=A0A0A6P7P7_9GAMM|nr:hypothetical protein PN36_04250 [Candidatus Thiomargarita nelsonii]
MPPNVTAAQGFDAVQQANVANGVWGDGRCFFHNFNQGHRDLCDGPAAGAGGAFGVPSAGPQSFAPGGAIFRSTTAFLGDLLEMAACLLRYNRVLAQPVFYWVPFSLDSLNPIVFWDVVPSILG